MPDLTGEVVVVTGSSRGIGAATALELARQGAKVVLAARSKAQVEAVAETIRAEGGEALACGCDVSSFEAVQTLRASALERYETITGLVNNAGVVEPIARLEASDPTLWAQAITINLVGAYNTTRALLSLFYEQDKGVIVNLSSGAAFTPLEGWSAYCSSKAGLAMLTRALALEAAEKNVFAYGFAPGLVDTDMQAQIRASGINRVSQVAQSSLSQPQQIAKAVAWLFTPAATNLSGQELDVRDPALRRRIGLEVSS